MERVRLLRIKAVTEMVGLSRASVYRLEKKTLFPARVKLTECAVAWRENEIEAWIAERQPVEQAA